MLFLLLFYSILIEQNNLLLLAEEPHIINPNLIIEDFLYKKYFTKCNFINRHLLFIIKQFIKELPQEYTILDSWNQESLTQIGNLFDSYLYYNRLLQISFNIFIFGVFFYLTPLPLIKVWSIIGVGIYLDYNAPLVGAVSIANFCYISSCYKNDNNFTAILGVQDLMQMLKALDEIFKP